MLLLTDGFIFNLDEVLYVARYDSLHIRIVYKNEDEKVFAITYEEFYNALNQLCIR